MSEAATLLSDLGMIRASKERNQNAQWKREEKAECGVGDSGGKGPRDWQPEEIKTDRRRGERQRKRAPCRDREWRGTGRQPAKIRSERDKERQRGGRHSGE